MNGQIGRFFTFKDAVDVSGQAAKDVCRIDALGHQPACGGEIAVRINCRQSRLRNKRNDLVRMGGGEDVGEDDHGRAGYASGGNNGVTQMIGVIHPTSGYLDAEARRSNVRFPLDWSIRR